MKTLRVAFLMMVAAIALVTAPAAARAGTVSPNVVGGSPAQQGEFPWMVRLDGGAFGSCGGTLYTPLLVLTAAQCIGGGNGTVFNDTDFTATIGNVDLQSPNAQRVRSSKVFVPAGFSIVTLEQDWALVQLEHPVTGVPTLPIANTDRYNNGTFTAAGWGSSTGRFGGQERFLRKVDLPFVDDNTCRGTYPGLIFDEMLCAGNGGGDVCTGDEGGPLFRRDANNNFIQVGIISGNSVFECGRPGIHGIFTELRTFAQQIATRAAMMDPDSFKPLVVNAASFAPGPVPSGSYLTVYTKVPVTDEAQSFSPAIGTTPAGLSVQSSACGGLRLPISYVGPSGFGGTQINVYYPNDYLGGANKEPFGTCPSNGTSTFAIHPTPGYGPDQTTAVSIVDASPGLFANGDTPVGYHVNVATGANTPFSVCNTDPSRCPATSNGQQNVLVVFTTGAEKYGCPEPGTSCTPPLSGLRFSLAPQGGTYVPQGLEFIGWAGFLGQEQANIRLAPGTTPGVKKLRIDGGSQELKVTLG